MAIPSNKRSRAEAETSRNGRRISHVVGFDDAPFERSHRGDVPDGWQAVVALHSLAQFILQRRGLGRRHLPGAFDHRLHGSVARAAQAAALARKRDGNAKRVRVSSMRCNQGFDAIIRHQ